MSTPFPTKLVGRGYVDSVPLRFNSDDADALRELGIDYATLRRRDGFDCAYLDVTVTFWDNFDPDARGDLSTDARLLCNKIDAAATFCDW